MTDEEMVRVIRDSIEQTWGRSDLSFDFDEAARDAVAALKRYEDL